MAPHRPVTAALLAAALALTACGSSDTGSAPSTTAATTSTASGTSCADAVREQAVVTDDLIDHGCRDDNGSKRVGTVKTCKNGQRLWEMGDWMGLSGEVMLKAEQKTPDGVPARILFDMVCTG